MSTDKAWFIERFKAGHVNSYDALISTRMQYWDILVSIDERDYQGDSWRLYKEFKSNRIGYLCFGWGSCSGCDALERYISEEDAEGAWEFHQELVNSVKWFDSADEALKWFNEHDWEGDYTWKSKEHRLFVALAKTYLTELLKDDL